VARAAPSLTRFISTLGIQCEHNPHDDYDMYDSPLMHASSNGDAGMVTFLLGVGADPALHVGISQRTAEGYARSSHPDIAALLRKAEDGNVPNQSSDPILSSGTSRAGHEPRHR
jgi:hypothetical protein